MPNDIESIEGKKDTMHDSESSALICAAAAEAAKAEKESIHSGQFMVSHFEAEEAMDDLDDSEVKMLDPEDPSLLKVDEPNACMQVQLFVPRKVNQIKKEEHSAVGVITSHLEIETSLTKLFKCMNLAYSQKLTSPKWNHFKGVRLRWKDKIRLNNVIWRCWHMQFILKRRTPVCQFASPLDVDIHSNPQSVVLEGKYWKRQLTVIKAEYRKWRRNYKYKTTGCLSFDTRSEFDFLEWSPLNERNLILHDDWTSDTLFSAINVPFPFPDPREIARGAGIADFIQPSLGPLQPNLDDIDLTFADLLQNSRLPPVPEEGTDEMLKNVDYGFSAIMGPVQMDSSSIMEVAPSNINQIQTHDDANMLELNTPLNTMQFTEIEQQFVSRGIHLLNEATGNSESVSDDAVMMEQRIGTPLSNCNQSKHFGSTNANDFLGKSVIKGRISKNQRPFRREPHNYDKAQPTPHQYKIYQQTLAEQQQQQHNPQNNIQSHNSNHHHHQPSTFLEHQQLQMQYPPQQFSNTSLINSNKFNSASTSRGVNNNSGNNIFSMPGSSPAVDSNIKQFGFSESISHSTVTNQAANQSVMLNVKIEPPSSGLQSFLNLKSTHDIYGSEAQPSGAPGLQSYRPYSNNQTIKKSASTGTYLNIRQTGTTATYIHDSTQNQPQRHVHAQSLPLSLNSLYSTTAHALLSPTSSQQKQQLPPTQQQQQQKQHVAMPKEMFRSNSLPLNVSLHRMSHDNFAMPKYHAKSNKTRSRSNSIHQHITSGTNNLGSTTQVSQRIQPASSDPLLNSTLAQLLTTNPRISLDKQLGIANNTVSSLNVPLISPKVEPANLLITSTNASVVTSNQQHPQHPLQSQIQQHIPKSPVKSSSMPVSVTPIMQQSPRANKMLSYPPPCGPLTCSTSLSLSPESFQDREAQLSPGHSLKIPRDSQRRVGHIHAEQKRRYNIKNGFDMLHSLIPQLQHCSSSKLSKAAMLQKGAEHIKLLRTERNALKETLSDLSKERDLLNNSLTHLHTILPANGAPLLRQGTEHIMQLYQQYVQFRTLSNWKFWVLGLILEPLLTSYTTSVSSASMDELRRTAYLWIDQHCSLIDLRPAVSNKLKYLSMKTDILSDPPSTLREEVKKAINNLKGQHPNLHGS